LHFLHIQLSPKLTIAEVIGATLDKSNPEKFPLDGVSLEFPPDDIFPEGVSALEELYASISRLSSIFKNVAINPPKNISRIIPIINPKKPPKIGWIPEDLPR